MSMNTAFFRSLLVKNLRELQFEACKTSKRMRMDEAHFPDPVDRAAIELDRSVELTIRGQEMLMIQEIQKALKRIDQGAFGVCESCGEPISEKRLRAKPTSRLCVYCKAKEENLQKSSCSMTGRESWEMTVHEDEIINQRSFVRDLDHLQKIDMHNKVKPERQNYKFFVP